MADGLKFLDCVVANVPDADRRELARALKSRWPMLKASVCKTIAFRYWRTNMI